MINFSQKKMPEEKKKKNFDPNIGKKTQWKKGQSGNPMGRNGSITDILREIGKGKTLKYQFEFEGQDGKKKKIKGNLKTTGGSKGSINRVLASVLFKKALQGDLKAMDMVLDRTEGKPEAKITNIDGGKTPISAEEIENMEKLNSNNE